MATLVKLTRIFGYDDHELRGEEYVNLDHVRVILPRLAGLGSAIAFGDPAALPADGWRNYAESPEHIAHLAVSESPQAVGR